MFKALYLLIKLIVVFIIAIPVAIFTAIAMFTTANAEERERNHDRDDA